MKRLFLIVVIFSRRDTEYRGGFCYFFALLSLKSHNSLLTTFITYSCSPQTIRKNSIRETLERYFLSFSVIVFSLLS